MNSKIFYSILFSFFFIYGFSGQLYVNTLSGEKITLNVELSNSIRIVKNKIYAAKGYNIAEQRLLYGGNVLDDSRTLSYYNIQFEKTLSLTLLFKLKNDSIFHDTINTNVNEQLKIKIPDSIFLSKPDYVRLFELGTTTIPDWLTYNSADSSYIGTPKIAETKIFTIHGYKTNYNSNYSSDSIYVIIKEPVSTDINNNNNSKETSINNLLFLKDNNTIAAYFDVETEYKIYDVNGRLIKQGNFQNSRIDIQDLLPAIYVLYTNKMSYKFQKK